MSSSATVPYLLACAEQPTVVERPTFYLRLFNGVVGAVIAFQDGSLITLHRQVILLPAPACQAAETCEARVPTPGC